MIERINTTNGNRGLKILVAYASQYGSTKEIAETTGEVLGQLGNTVETINVTNVAEVANYDAAIVGSAIQFDKWMPEAREFVAKHQKILSKLPVAYFFTCLTLSVQGEKSRRQAKAYSDKLYALVPQVKPLDIGSFAGVLDYGKLPFFFRLLSRVIYLLLGVGEGDYRDWRAIRTWAKSVNKKIIEQNQLKGGYHENRKNA
jgi:menaquinone-dependent protoporphyrinogen oxidase